MRAGLAVLTKSGNVGGLTTLHNQYLGIPGRVNHFTEPMAALLRRFLVDPVYGQQMMKHMTDLYFKLQRMPTAAEATADFVYQN